MRSGCSAICGAICFRAIGEPMVYGLSARAMALGTGGNGPDEFPHFIQLRLHPAESETIRIEGMIDSPALTAHLDMVLCPGVDTEMEIATTIFPRVENIDIEITPLRPVWMQRWKGARNGGCDGVRCPD